MNMTVNQIALFYEISKQTMYNWLKGSYVIKNENRIYNRTYCEKDKPYIDYVTKYIINNPQFIIKELLRNLILLFGIGISRQTIYNICKKYNITRKRVQIDKYPHNKEKYENERKRLQKQIKCRKNRIMSIDETSIPDQLVGNNIKK